MTNTTNNTYTNFSSTIMSDQFQEYLDNQMFVPLIAMSWLFLITNHKYHQCLAAFESFKAQSADEIFSLQESLARDDTAVDSITDTDRSVYASGLPFSVLSDAVANYALFHKTPVLCVSLDDVLCSSGGIKGWAEHRVKEETTTKKVKKQKQKQKPSEYNLFLKKSIADIKRDNPEIQHQLAFLQATKQWQRKKA